MDLGISVSTYSDENTPGKRFEIIERCLDALLKVKNKYKIYISVVVDGKITDFHEQLLSKYDFDIMKNPCNMGVSYTKNRGINSILHRDLNYGFLMDDDTIITRIEIIENYYNTMVNEEIDHLAYFVERDNPKLIPIGQNLMVTPHVHGCFMTFTRKLIEKIGYFKLLPYKFGHEHSDFSVRACTNEYRCTFMDIQENGFDTYMEDCEDGISKLSTYQMNDNFNPMLLEQNSKYMAKGGLLRRRITFAPISEGIVKYYINLDRSHERLESMKKQFPDAIRVRAYNGFNLHNYGDIIMPKNYLNISKSELGCTFSHIKTIMYAYINNNDGALILEDDVYKPTRFQIKRIINQRPSGAIV